MFEDRVKQYKAMLERVRAEHAARAVKDKQKPPPVPPLVDQLRDLLATLPAAQKERISLPLILPHLKGKYREHPHYIQIGKALRLLGYKQTRSWNKSDEGCRYWIKADTI